MSEEITPEQWEVINSERDRFIEIGLCTKPSDRDTTEEVIRIFYDHIGEAHPQFVWVSSPLAAIRVICMLEHSQAELTKRGKYDPKASWPKIIERALARQKEWDPSTNMAGILDLEREYVSSAFATQLWGQSEIFWVGYYMVMRDVLGVTYDETNNRLLNEIYRLACSSSWWFPYAEVCVCVERPRAIHREDEVLHCATGPAVGYEDGYGVYQWRGTRVEREWIENPKSIKPEEIIKWPNVEQRRCGIEIMGGWHNVLPLLPHKVIDEDHDEMIGKLVEADIPDSGKERFIIAKCGTGRTISLCVPPDMKTAIEANAWTQNIPPEALRALEIRT